MRWLTRLYGDPPFALSQALEAVLRPSTQDCQFEVQICKTKPEVSSERLVTRNLAS